MEKYKLPTREECFEIIKKYRVPPHIVEHSITTAKLAVFLAQKLKEKGVEVNAELVDRACLLHDLARFCDFSESDLNNLEPFITEKDKTKWQQLKAEYEGLCHEEVAYEILKNKYPELALVIKKHRYMAILDEKEKPITWEEKLVYYAEKRVMHNRIVPLKKRLEEAHKRNVHLHGTQIQSDINTRKVDPLIFKLEEEIFSKIDIPPDLPDLS